MKKTYVRTYPAAHSIYCTTNLSSEETEYCAPYSLSLEIQRGQTNEEFIMDEQQRNADYKRLMTNKRSQEYRARKKARLLEQYKRDPKRCEMISKPPPIKEPDWTYMSLGEYLNQNRFDFCRQAPKQPDPVVEMREVEQQLRIKYGIDSAQAGAHQYKLRQTNCRLKKSIEDGQRCKCNDECGVACLNLGAGEMCTQLNCRVYPKICKNNWMDCNMMVTCIPVTESEVLGKGLKTTIDIESGKIIGPYVGELTDRKAKGIGTYRVDLTLKGKVKGKCIEVCIDSKKRGNILRFINHSCKPNCKFVKMNVYGIETLWVKCIKEIKAGNFLSMHYNKKFDPCCCEACM